VLAAEPFALPLPLQEALEHHQEVVHLHRPFVHLVDNHVAETAEVRVGLGRKGGREGGREEGREGGREEGRKGGREEGRKKGRKGGKEGRKAGRQERMKAGRQEGRKEGRN
jgi:hypothetical protein